MGKKDARVDAYIAKSADFAKPILKHLRSAVHSAYPRIEEQVKWGMPFFAYKGPVAHMAAFKRHCAFGFWKQRLVLAGEDPSGGRAKAMGQFGRITSVKELPAKNVIK